MRWNARSEGGLKALTWSRQLASWLYAQQRKEEEEEVVVSFQQSSVKRIVYWNSNLTIITIRVDSDGPSCLRTLRSNVAVNNILCSRLSVNLHRRKIIVITVLCIAVSSRPRPIRQYEYRGSTTWDWSGIRPMCRLWCREQSVLVSIHSKWLSTRSSWLAFLAHFSVFLLPTILPYTEIVFCISPPPPPLYMPSTHRSNNPHNGWCVTMAWTSRITEKRN